VNLLETSGPVQTCTEIAVPLLCHNTEREFSKNASRLELESPAKTTVNTNIVEHQMNLAVLPPNEIFPPLSAYCPAVPP